MADLSSDPRFASYPLVPQRLRPGLIRYLDDGIRPGGFLCAVLANDLTEAMIRADRDYTVAAFVDLISFLQGRAPHVCWGSPDAREAWIKRHHEARAMRAKLEKPVEIPPHVTTYPPRGRKPNAEASS